MVVVLSDTFLTEGRPMDLPEPEAMTRCREEHSKLQTVVFSLNQKISQVLSKQEGDFLAAYRAHMYTVQKELQTLRQRVVEAENVLQKNDKVQKLEDECDWYRKEALRLDNFNTAMKEDLKYMKGKLEALEDDRNWLARQLKASKKQDKVLRAELGLRIDADEENERALTAESSQRSAIQTGQSHPPLAGALRSLDSVRRKQHISSSPMLLSSEQARSRNEGGLRYEAPLRRIQLLERRLAKERTDLSRARATNARNAVERVEMEDFFLQCVEDVKRDIDARKRRGRALHSRTAGPRIPRRQHFNPGNGNIESIESLDNLPSPAHGSVSSKTIALKDFTPTDRRSVIEALLKRKEVAAHLFDMFFPVASTKPVPRGGADEEAKIVLPTRMESDTGGPPCQK